MFQDLHTSQSHRSKESMNFIINLFTFYQRLYMTSIVILVLEKFIPQPFIIWTFLFVNNHVLYHILLNTRLSIYNHKNHVSWLPQSFIIWASLFANNHVPCHILLNTRLRIYNHTNHVSWLPQSCIIWASLFANN